MKHVSHVLLVFLIVMVLLASPTPVKGETVSPCPPTTVTHVARWHKVASYTNDDFNGFSGPHNPAIPNQMIPEPGMPQALGFASWQGLYDDIVAVDGEVVEIAMQYEGSANNHPTTDSFVQYPAHPGILPEGQPSRAEPHEWIYFAWDHIRNPITPNTAYVRFQHDPGGPILLFDLGINAGWDRTYSLWVKM